jgi:hypothetical protein
VKIFGFFYASFTAVSPQFHRSFTANGGETAVKLTHFMVKLW